MGSPEIPDDALGDDLAQLVGLLVDEPEDLNLREEIGRSGDRVFKVEVPEHDLGKLIGRQGRTARSLRAFLETRGKLDGRRYALEILEV
ncbi:MAG: KH domain-containing protein [Acidobacteriota bacterium]